MLKIREFQLFVLFPNLRLIRGASGTPFEGLQGDSWGVLCVLCTGGMVGYSLNLELNLESGLEF